MTQIRQLVVISDIHAGSTKAILPPNFTTLEGQPIGQSELQKWFWRSWELANAWINELTGIEGYAWNSGYVGFGVAI